MQARQQTGREAHPSIVAATQSNAAPGPAHSGHARRDDDPHRGDGPRSPDTPPSYSRASHCRKLKHAWGRVPMGSQWRGVARSGLRVAHKVVHGRGGQPTVGRLGAFDPSAPRIWPPARARELESGSGYSHGPGIRRTSVRHRLPPAIRAWAGLICHQRDTLSRTLLSPSTFLARGQAAALPRRLPWP
jgi:hypothetical protein